MSPRFFGSPSRELAALADAVRRPRDHTPIDAFRIEAAWGPRAATPRRIAECLVRTAHRLHALDTRLDILFSERRYVCSSAAEPVLERAREHSIERMARRVSDSSGRHAQNLERAPRVPRLGAGSDLCAELDAGSSGARLRVRAGHDAAPDADNGVSIELGATHFMLPDKPLVRDTLAALIDVWQPDLAGLHSGVRAPDGAPRRWWLAWTRDDFDPYRAPLRRGWPGTLPGAGEPLLDGRLWEWPAHAPAALLAAQVDA